MEISPLLAAAFSALETPERCLQVANSVHELQRIEAGADFGRGAPTAPHAGLSGITRLTSLSRKLLTAISPTDDGTFAFASNACVVVCQSLPIPIAHRILQERLVLANNLLLCWSVATANPSAENLAQLRSIHDYISFRTPLDFARKLVALSCIDRRSIQTGTLNGEELSTLSIPPTSALRMGTLAAADWLLPINRITKVTRGYTMATSRGRLVFIDSKFPPDTMLGKPVAALIGQPRTLCVIEASHLTEYVSHD